MDFVNLSHKLNRFQAKIYMILFGGSFSLCNFHYNVLTEKG